MQSYFENKINSHNFIDYLYRIVFIIASDIVVCWIKSILVVKFSGVKASVLKLIALEISVFHEKMKYDCFNNNGVPANDSYSSYIKILENFSFSHINRDSWQKYSHLLDFDSILNLELRNNVVIPCVIVILN